MWVRIAMVLPLLAATVGCSSLAQQELRADYFELQHQGVRALRGQAAAFDRVDALLARWEERAADCPAGPRQPVCSRSGQDQARLAVEQARRVSLARKPVLAQQTQVDVMANALRDLESEFDGVIALEAEGDAPAASQVLAAEQKYLVRRMRHSLALMSALDMGGAVEAADAFGRDVVEFQRLLDKALNGDEEAGIEPPANPEVEESLAQIDELFNGYVADSADDLLENVVYRYDAWLALDVLASAHDGAGAPATGAAKAAADAADEDAGGEEAAGQDADDAETVDDATDTPDAAAEDIGDDENLDE